MEKRNQKHSSSSISIFPEEEDKDLYFDEVNEEELLSLYNDINLQLFQDKYEEVPTNTVKSQEQKRSFNPSLTSVSTVSHSNSLTSVSSVSNSKYATDTKILSCKEEINEHSVASDSNKEGDEASDSDLVSPQQKMNEDITDSATLLNVILCNPEDFEMKQKPVGIRKNFFCTLDRENIPVSSAKADDNGAYVRRGNFKSLIHVTFDTAQKVIMNTRTCRKDDNSALYLNERVGSGYKRAYIENEDVFELSREYRQSKANPTFSHMIATARRYNETSLQQYYVTCYRWMDGENQENLSNEENFVLPRHGNAVKPTAAVYYRTDSKVLCTSRKEITNNKNYDDIYKTVNTTNDFSVGTEIRNPKQLYNIKQSLQKTEEHKLHLSAAGEHSKSTGEIESIIGLMRAENSESSSFVHSLTILPNH